MKRTLLLLLPVIAFAATGSDHGVRKSTAAELGELWQASVSAESGGDADAALAKVAEYGKSGGDAYLVAIRVAWLKYSKKEYDEAGRHYADAAKLQAGALSPRLGMLNVAQGKGDVVAAAKAAEWVLQLEPTHYQSLMAVAWAAFQKKDYRKAGGAYRRAAGFYPEDQDAQSGVAWCAFYTGQKREARTAFQRLISMNPTYPDADKGIEATR